MRFLVQFVFCGVSFSVLGSYHPDSRGTFYARNGDPGDPSEPDEIGDAFVFIAVGAVWVRLTGAIYDWLWLNDKFVDAVYRAVGDYVSSINRRQRHSVPVAPPWGRRRG